LFRAVRRISMSEEHKHWCERLGWIDGNRVRNLQQEMERLHSAGDRAYIRFVWPLWMVCALDMWSNDRHSGSHERYEGRFEVHRASAWFPSGI